jgi:hypothetical protein
MTGYRLRVGRSCFFSIGVKEVSVASDYAATCVWQLPGRILIDRVDIRSNAVP